MNRITGIGAHTQHLGQNYELESDFVALYEEFLRTVRRILAAINPEVYQADLLLLRQLIVKLQAYFLPAIETCMTELPNFRFLKELAEELEQVYSILEPPQDGINQGQSNSGEFR